jgi:hypothetical protein
MAMVVFVLLVTQARGQSAADLTVLKGLAPITVLWNTPAGNAALGANYTVTGGIETGRIVQPTLLPFSAQQQQALRDAFITGSNLAELADGLGTTLGSVYVARYHYLDQTQTSPMPRALGDLIAYATAVSGTHSNQGKYLFANETTDGKTAVPAEEAAVIKDLGGAADVFGKAYKLPAGTAGADAYGNSRPFQTEQGLTEFDGPDYLNRPSGNYVYNHGPAMDLTNSPSYPSGHTTYGYTGAILLAVLVPERYPQMVARGAEYGTDRIIMGSHYAMDVLGGRTLALYDMAHLLANDSDYVGLTLGQVTPIKDFQGEVRKARAELADVLQKGCGNSVEICAGEDIGRFNNAAADSSFYESTQTYNLPAVYATNAGVAEDVSKLAPKAGYLLTVAFPSLSLDEADKILTETEGPGGGFLDNGSEFGVFSRLNLYAAAVRAEQAVAKK